MENNWIYDTSSGETNYYLVKETKSTGLSYFVSIRLMYKENNNQIIIYNNEDIRISYNQYENYSVILERLVLNNLFNKIFKGKETLFNTSIEDSRSYSERVQ